MNRFAMALSTSNDLDEAMDEVARATKKELGTLRPSLAFVFVGHEHAAGFADLPRKIPPSDWTRLLDQQL